MSRPSSAALPGALAGSALVGAALLAALLGATLLAAACSSPTEPAANAPGSNVRPSAVATKVTITVGATTLVLDTSTTLTVTVDREGPPDPAIVQVGISTTLGNFGLDESGQDIQTLTCTATNADCRLETLSDTGQLRAQATFNAGTEEGTATIVATAGSVTGMASITVETPPPLFLERLDPLFGSPAGGTEVRIFGTGFKTSTPRVNFGDALAAFVGLGTDAATNDTFLVVTTPPSATEVPVGTTLAVDVEVTFPDDGSGVSAKDTLTGAFTYAHGEGPGGDTDERIRPSITSISPAVGPNRGGPTILLLGSGFDTRGVNVMFGIGKTVDEFQGIEASLLGAPSDSQVAVELPPATPDLRNQTVDILLRNNATGLFALSTSSFTYQSEDVILSLDPQQLTYRKRPEESRIVVITGRGLADGPSNQIDPLQVEFGGQVQATCGGAPSNMENCTVSSSGETLRISEALEVTVSECMPPSGDLMITNTRTGEVSMGPSFAYSADLPAVESLDPAKEAQDDDTSTPTGTFSTLMGTFSTLEASTTTVLVDGAAAAVSTVTESTIAVLIPPFSGSFDEVDCGDGGKMFVEKAVDVEVVYNRTGCSATLAGGFTYIPGDMSCRAQAGPTANFTAGTPSGAAMLTVQFTDTSSGGPEKWSWDFGDGTTSNEQNPSHTFPEGGTFNVTLIVENEAGSASITKAVTVGLDPAKADFDFTVNGLNVTFTNKSENATDFAWDFGDGMSSTAVSPTHAYAGTGTFNVTLTASNASSEDSITKPVTVAVEPPVASFTFALDASDSSRLTVDFTDTSSGAVNTRVWRFGDGASDATNAASVSHTYASAGTFDVTLTVANAGGSNSLTQSVTVGLDPPVASFTFSKDSSDPSGRTFLFVDTSTGNPTSISWDFGDGGGAGVSPVTHVYATNGSFAVTLTATNAGGSSSVTQVVEAIPDPPVAAFTFSVMGMSVQFTNTSTGQIDSFVWFFGDGTSDSATASPLHVYPASGSFIVTLQVRNGGGTNSLSQTVVIP